MDAKELRPGNTVSLYGSETFIHPTDYSKWLVSSDKWELNGFKPVPLKDKLYFEGFELIDKHPLEEKYYRYKWLYFYPVAGGPTPQYQLKINNQIFIPTVVKHLHHLQNIIFDLFNEELIRKR